MGQKFWRWEAAKPAGWQAEELKVQHPSVAASFTISNRIEIVAQGNATPLPAVNMGWFSSLVRDDRVILGALGTSTIAMLLMVRFMLEKWREDAEIKPVQPKTQYITQDTEDALQVGTLDTLLGHYNFAIRETAAKIVCERAVNEPSTLDILLRGITRPDYDERIKNLRALAVITDHRKI